jgi:hypothetical protein
LINYILLFNLVVNNHLKHNNYGSISKKETDPVNASWFLPTMNTFFDDFLSKDLMEMTGPNFATLEPICHHSI